MKTIIAGSRTVTNSFAVVDAIERSGIEITEVVSGCARGVDTMGEAWAQGSQIPIKRFPADWKQFGKAAGPRRNVQMAEYADALIAVWDGRSPGKAHMINVAHEHGLEVFVSVPL